MPVDRLYRFDPPIGYVTLLEVVSMLKELYPLVREDQLQQIPTSRLTRYFVPGDGVLATSVVPLLTTLPASLLSVLSPTTLSSTQNNYNPAGLDAHDRFRLSASVAVSLTGLMAPDPATGRQLIIFNVGLFNIGLVNNSPSSSVGNRFLTTANITLQPNGSATLYYDPVSLGWRVVAVR